MAIRDRNVVWHCEPSEACLPIVSQSSLLSLAFRTGAGCRRGGIRLERNGPDEVHLRVEIDRAVAGVRREPARIRRAVIRGVLRLEVVVRVRRNSILQRERLRLAEEREGALARRVDRGPGVTGDARSRL